MVFRGYDSSQPPENLRIKLVLKELVGVWYPVAYVTE